MHYCYLCCHICVFGQPQVIGSYQILSGWLKRVCRSKNVLTGGTLYRVAKTTICGCQYELIVDKCDSCSDRHRTQMPQS